MSFTTNSLKSCYLTIILGMMSGFTLPANAQAPDWIWYKELSTGGNEFITSVAVDPSDNSVYAGGNWSNNLSAVFPDGTYPHNRFNSTYGLEDGFLVKFDSAGNYLWGFKLGSSSNDRVNSMTVDSDGSVYITGFMEAGTGYFYGTSAPDGSAELTNSSGEDFFLAKYDASGAFQWIRRSETNTGNVVGEDVCTNSSSVFAVGRYHRSADFGPLFTHTNPNDDDAFLICYDKDGTEQWIATGGSNGEDRGQSVVADESSVFLTGWFEGGSFNVFDGNGNWQQVLNNKNAGTGEIFLLSFDTAGFFRWGHMIHSNSTERGRGLCMDSDSLYLTGALNDNSDFPGYAGNPVSTSSSRDIFLSSHAKSDGLTGWVRVFPCTAPGIEKGRNLDITPDNHLILIGEFRNDLTFPGGPTITSDGVDDVFLTAYTTGGEFLWGQGAGSSGDEDGNAIAVGNQGALYIGGLYNNQMDAGPFTLGNDAGDNGFLFKLQESGLPPANDDPCGAILLDNTDTCVYKEFDNSWATSSGIADPGCGNYGGYDLWFKTIIPSSGNLFIGTNTSTDLTYPPVNGWMWKPVMALYTGTCDNLTYEGCYANNSAYNWKSSSAYLQNQNPGDTVWIRIWENGGGDNGRFSLCAFDPGHYPAWDLPSELCEGNGPINLDTTITEPWKGFADQEVGFGNIPDPGDALGAPDNSQARLHDDGDWIKLDLTDTIPPGEVFEIHFRSRTSVSGVTQISLSTSLDNSTYHPFSFQPETSLDNVTAHALIAERPTRYLYIQNIAAGGGGFDIDAVTYQIGGTKGGTWSGPGVTGSNFDPSGLSGPVQLTYSVGGTTTLTDSTRMTFILASKSGILSGDTTVCAGDHEVTLVLEESVGSILDWESSTNGFSSSVSLGVSDSSLIISNLIQTTDFRAIVQNGTCIPDTSNIIRINVVETPLANPGPGGTVCGNVIGLQAIPSVGVGQWSVKSGPGIAIFTPSVDDPIVSVEVDQSGTYEFTWTETNGICSDDSTLQFTFFALPAVNPGVGGDTCGLSFNLQAIPSIGTGTWSLNSGPGTASFAPSDTVPDPLVSVSEFGTYSFSWRELNGTCSSGANVFVEFLETPIADPGSGGRICGSLFGLQASPSTGAGAWSKTSGPGIATFLPDAGDPAADVEVDLFGSYEFKWTETNGSCSDDSSITVIFDNLPAINPGAGGDTCALNFKLNALLSLGSGKWTLNSGPGTALFFPSDTVEDPLVSVSLPGNYIFSWEETLGSCSQSGMVTVNFNRPPPVDPGSGSEACGLEFRLNALPSFGSGSWAQRSGPGISSFDPSDSTPDALVNVSEYGSYEYIWTESDGICSADSVITIIFNAYPESEAGPDMEICAGVASISIGGASSSNGNVNWTSSGTGSFVAPDLDNPSYLPGPELNPVILYKTVTGICGEARDSMELSILPTPQAYAGDGGEVCGLEFQLSAVPSLGNGSWSIASGTGDASFSPSINDPGATVSVTLQGDYEFTWTETMGSCSDMGSLTVRFFEQPLADAGPDQVILASFETSLEANVPESGSGTWSLVSGSGLFDNENDPYTRVSDLRPGENEFSWTVTNGVCSDAIDNVIITVDESSTITPTIITPNADGLNDLLVFPQAVNEGPCSLVIFNRWGTEVYRNNDYQNDWDGKDHKGRELINDTYFYILKIPPEQIFKSYVEIRK